MRLNLGQVLVENLVIGADPASDPAAAGRNEGLATASGTGCLVASSWGIKPGYVKVQLPEIKAAGKGKT